VELIHAYLIYGRNCRSKAEIQVNSFQYIAQRSFICIYDVNKIEVPPFMSTAHRAENNELKAVLCA
jgi:hypothetical protein